MKYRTTFGSSRSCRQLASFVLLLVAMSVGEVVEAFPPIVAKCHPAASTTTKLKVSELHVPGYIESKIPFILKEQDLVLQPSQNVGASAVVQRRSLAVQSYSPEDYESLIPFKEGYLLHRTKNQVFSSHECQQIIAEAEQVASEIEWTRNRHGHFPTTDLPLVELPQTLKFLRLALEERLYPLLRSQFGTYLPNPNKLRVADGFVVKYDALGGQTDLKPHRDGSVLSFNIALNPGKSWKLRCQGGMSLTSSFSISLPLGIFSHGV